jgi:hypothetical protein
MEASQNIPLGFSSLNPSRSIAIANFSEVLADSESVPHNQTGRAAGRAGAD